MFVFAARAASSEQCPAAGIEFCLQKELCESRMRPIGSTVIETHFRITFQFGFPPPPALVDQSDDANFRIGIRYDTNGAASVDFSVSPAKLCAISLQVKLR